jgi:hypothetical protein
MKYALKLKPVITTESDSIRLLRSSKLLSATAVDRLDSHTMIERTGNPSNINRYFHVVRAIVSGHHLHSNTITFLAYRKYEFVIPTICHIVRLVNPIEPELHLSRTCPPALFPTSSPTGEDVHLSSLFAVCHNFHCKSFVSTTCHTSFKAAIAFPTLKTVTASIAIAIARLPFPRG